MLKKFIIFIAIIAIIVLSGLFLTKKPQQNAISSQTPTVLVNENELLIASVKSQLIEEHGSGASTLEVSVTEIVGDYAKGVANESDGHRGGLWFAAKVDGEWKLVDDGNGVTTCDKLDNYPSFPSKLLQGCFDKTTGEIRMR